MPSETKVRTQEARRIINKEMRKFYKISVIDRDDLELLRSCKTSLFIKALNKMLEKQDKKFVEVDYYYPSVSVFTDVKSVNSHMYYISDRWNCAGRIKFILRVLEEVK